MFHFTLSNSSQMKGEPYLVLIKRFINLYILVENVLTVFQLIYFNTKQKTRKNIAAGLKNQNHKNRNQNIPK